MFQPTAPTKNSDPYLPGSLLLDYLLGLLYYSQGCPYLKVSPLLSLMLLSSSTPFLSLVEWGCGFGTPYSQRLRLLQFHSSSWISIIEVSFGRKEGIQYGVFHSSVSVRSIILTGLKPQESFYLSCLPLCISSTSLGRSIIVISSVLLLAEQALDSQLSTNTLILLMVSAQKI